MREHIYSHSRVIKIKICDRYSASSLVLPLFGILTFIGISSCRRGCVWGAKFRFGVFVCLSLMFLET